MARVTGNNTLLTKSEITTLVGAGYQPLDSDLTTIAGLTATTDNFLVSVSSAWASRTPTQVRTTLGLVIGTDVQAYDPDLTTWAGITPGANVGTFLATPSSANLLAAITNETGTGLLVFNDTPTLIAPLLGTPTSGNLANCTFPTLNQNTTGTAAALTTPRTIGGVSFDGTANIVPQTIQSINEATDTTCFPLFISASGSQSLQPLNNTNLTFNSNTGSLGSTLMVATTSLTSASILASSNDSGALGASGTAFSDLFLASGAVINFNAGDVLMTHSANTLTFTGASSGYLYDAMNAPSSNDAAALGSTTLMWSDLFLASGGVMNFNNGNVTLTHSAANLTIAGGNLNLATGSTTLAPLKFAAGTNLTTAEDGAIEMDADCFYACTDAANRGYLPVVHMIRQNANRANFANNTNQQAIFDSVAGGTLTLETGVYEFEGVIQIQGMSGTSGNLKFSLIGAGGATLTQVLYVAVAMDAAVDTLTAWSGVAEIVSTQVATNIATASTATVCTFTVKGTFKVTGAGSIIPSVAQTTAINNSANTLAGSFFKVNRMGSTTVLSVGQWT